MKYFFGAEYTGKEKVDMIKQAQTEGENRTLGRCKPYCPENNNPRSSEGDPISSPELLLGVRLEQFRNT